MVNDSLQPAGAPVAALNAAKLTAACSPVPPAATPGGRMAEKVPPAKTVPPAWASAYTMPFVCQVLRVSAVNVTGEVSAVACGAPASPASGAAVSATAAVTVLTLRLDGL